LTHGISFCRTAVNTSVWASGAPSLARTIRQKETPHERARSHGAVAEISRHGFEDRGSENRGSKQHCGSQRSVAPCRYRGVSTATATYRLGPKSATSGDPNAIRRAFGRARVALSLP